MSTLPLAIMLWVDDERPAPPGWIHARSFTEAIKLFQTGVIVTAISLDHDLGEEELVDPQVWTDYTFEDRELVHPTGYHLALWMLMHGRVPPEVYVHSANPVGREAIRRRRVPRRNSYPRLGRLLLITRHLPRPRSN
jgi:hypothetical protein